MTGSFHVRPQDKLRALAYYETCSKAYEAISGMGPLRLLRAREQGAVLRLAELGPPAVSMIDVGCGSGRYALAAKEAGLEVTALDASPGMLARVAAQVDMAILGDVESLPLDRTYDIVVCAGVLDFVLAPEKALLDLCRLVSPGGRLVLLVPSDRWITSLYRLEKRLSGMRVNLFSLEWITRLAAVAGLRPTRVEYPIPTSFVIRFERPVGQAGGVQGTSATPAS